MTYIVDDYKYLHASIPDNSYKFLGIHFKNTISPDTQVSANRKTMTSSLEI